MRKFSIRKNPGKRYAHSENAPVTWEECDIRQYLNSSFYESTFSDKEKNRILDSVLENRSNPKNVFGLDGGATTIDKVFLLSLDEAYQYMGDDAHIKLRTARVAKYIVTGEAHSWMLRSHGQGQYHYVGEDHYQNIICYSITIVGSNGTIYDDNVGSPMYLDTSGIRPAMRIKL